MKFVFVIERRPAVGLINAIGLNASPYLIVRHRYCVSIVSCIDRLEGIARSPRFHSPRDAIPMSSRMITRGGRGGGGHCRVANWNTAAGNCYSIDKLPHDMFTACVPFTLGLERFEKKIIFPCCSLFVSFAYPYKNKRVIKLEKCRKIFYSLRESFVDKLLLEDVVYRNVLNDFTIDSWLVI